MSEWVNDPSFTEGLTIHFAPSTDPYPTRQILVATPNSSRLRIQGDGIGSGQGKRAQVTIKCEDLAADSDDEEQHFILRSVPENDHGKPTFPINLIEVADLTLDCNWANQGAKARPVYTLGYKNGAMKIYAKYATIQNVAIKNFGANGIVPVRWDQPQGTEAFALLVFTDDLGQPEPLQAGDDPPVVIENCEVSDFTALHGGYCTGITIAGTRDNFENRDRSLAVVRGCQVRNLFNGIALGAAWAEWVTFKYNVVVDCTYGFNSDTYPLREITIEDNAFHYVWSGIHLGGVNLNEAKYTDYTISGNCVLLAGRALHKLYQDYYTSTYGVEVTDTNLLWARLATNVSSVVCLQGATARIRISDNLATTRRRDLFFPFTDEGARFRFVRVLDSNFKFLDNFGPYYRHPDEWPGDSDRSGNYICSYACDWDDLSVQVPTHPEGESDWLARPKKPDGFNPFSVAGRVEPVSISSLQFRELAIEEPSVQGSQVTVKARWRKQPGGATEAATVYFRVSGPNNSYGSAPTINGIASWAYTRGSGSGEDLIQAWVNGPGGTSSLEADLDYWAVTSKVWDPSLRVDATLDVASDKQTYRVGKITFTRTGALGSSVVVYFSLSGSAFYGTDFTLYSSDLVTFDPVSRTGTITIPENHSESVLEIRPLFDTLTEYEGVTVQVTGNSVGAGIAGPNEATVAIHDGPRYSVVELPGISTGSSRFAYAVNNSTINGGPDVVGWESYPRGLRWNRSYGTWQYWNLMPPQYYSYLVPYGVSDTLWIAGRANSVYGTTHAFRYQPSTGTTILGSLSGNSEALAVSPGNSPTYIVGYSYNSSGVPRAARWRSNNSWNVEDLWSLGSGLTVPSYAYGANSSGVVVGKSKLSPSGTVYHAFKTSGGSTIIVPTSDLGTLYDDPTYSSSGNAVNAGGAVVGQSQDLVSCQQPGHGNETQYRACYWPADWPGTQARDLGVLHQDSSNYGNLSEALGINNSGQIVGYSRTTHTGQQRAFLCDSYDRPMVDLNDPDLVYSDSGWAFLQAEAINNQGYIVGWGYHNGYTRAFVMVPTQ